jgi:hypothetical protein
MPRRNPPWQRDQLFAFPGVRFVVGEGLDAVLHMGDGEYLAPDVMLIRPKERVP